MTRASLCNMTYRLRLWLQVLSLGLAFGAVSATAAVKVVTTALQATVGTPYSYQLMASGGTPPYTWTTDPGSGSVPGLTLASDGTLSGTPTTPGLFQLNVDVKDSLNGGSKGTINVNVTPCVPTISNPNPLPSGDVGVRYPPVTLQGAGCSSPYSFTLQPDPFVQSALPPGLALNGNTIAGTPTATGTFNFAITVTDSTKDSAIYSYSLTVNPLPTFATPSVLPSGSVGSLYSLTIQATGGAPPYIFSMNNNPPALTLSPAGVLSGTPPAPGTFTFNIGVTDSLGGQTVSQFQVTFGNSMLVVNPSSLTFSAQAGGSAPDSQAVSVIAGSKAKSPAPYQITVNTDQPVIATAAFPSWLSVAPAAGNAPGSLLVSADQSNLGIGTYHGQITVVDAAGIPANIAVTFTVTAGAPPALAVVPGLLRFAARAAAPGTQTQTLWIRNSGGGSLGFNASVTGGSSWISLQPASGQTEPNSQARLHVIVNSQGLGIGAYRDVVHIASATGSTDVPVSLFIEGNGPIIGVDTTGVLFRMRQGHPSGSSRTIEVLNLGDPASNVNFTPTLASNASWLSVGAANGPATTTTPTALPLTLSPNAVQLSPGTYYALLEISDPNALNSPQYVTVVLQVQDGAAAALPDLAPNGLFFVATAGGARAAGQHVTVNTSASQAQPFQVSASTPDNTTWLSANPATGTASGQSPGVFTVTVNSTGLTPGVYSGIVNVSLGETLASVNVTFVLLPGAAASASSVSSHAASGCAPAKLALTETGMSNNFTVPAGWPATLIAQLNDDCGNTVTNGSVVASFSNGDAPLTLNGDSLGNYSATWQPGAVSAQLNITLNAASGALQPATALLIGGVAQNASQPPALPGNGVVNAFNIIDGGALSPGTIAEVFGTGLASSTVISTGAPPIPRIFNGTQMLVGGFAAPLFFLSNVQLNAQLPAELVPNQQYMAVISANGALSIPIQLDFIPLQPGVAAYTDGHVIAQHADYSLINAASPAKPGEVIIIYLLGMGATNPPVASGAAAPSAEPLARVTAQAKVTVDGQNASVAFAGMTPGDSGLYQIDFTVPGNATSGDLDLIVSQNGVASNTTKLPVHQ